MKKRILSFLLATVMAITSMPLVSFAEGAGGTIGDNLDGPDGVAQSVTIGNGYQRDGYRFSVTNVELATPIDDYSWGNGSGDDEGFKGKSIKAVQQTYDHCLPYGAYKAIYCFNGNAVDAIPGNWYSVRGSRIFNENLPALELPKQGERKTNKSFSGGYYVGTGSSAGKDAINSIISSVLPTGNKTSPDLEEVKKAGRKIASDSDLLKAYTSYLGYLSTSNCADNSVVGLDYNGLNALFGIDVSNDDIEANGTRMLVNMYAICAITGTDDSFIDEFITKYQAKKRITHIPMIQIESLLGCSDTVNSWGFSVSMGQLIGYCAGINDNTKGAAIFDPDNGVASSLAYAAADRGNCGSVLNNITQLAMSLGSSRITDVVRDVSSGRIWYDGSKPTRIQFSQFQVDEMDNWSKKAWGQCCHTNISAVMALVFDDKDEYRGYSFCWPFYVPPTKTETKTMSFTAKAIWEEKVDYNADPPPAESVETTDISRPTGDKVNINSYYSITGDAADNANLIDELKKNPKGYTFEFSLYTSELVPVGTVAPKRSRWSTHHYISDTPDGALAGGGNVPKFCEGLPAISKGAPTGTSVNNSGTHTVKITLNANETIQFLSGETAVYFKSRHFRKWTVPNDTRYKTESHIKVTVGEETTQVDCNELYVTPYKPSHEGKKNPVLYKVSEDERFPVKEVEEGSGFNWGCNEINSEGVQLNSIAYFNEVTGNRDFWTTSINFEEANDFLSATMDKDLSKDTAKVIITCPVEGYEEINPDEIQWSAAACEVYGNTGIPKLLTDLSLASADAYNNRGTAFTVTVPAGDVPALREIIRTKSAWSIYGCPVAGIQKEDMSLMMTFNMDIEYEPIGYIAGAPVTVRKDYPMNEEEIPKQAGVWYHVLAKPDAYVFESPKEGEGKTYQKLHEWMLLEPGNSGVFPEVDVTFTISPEYQYNLECLKNEMVSGNIKIDWDMKPSTLPDYVPGIIAWNNAHKWGVSPNSGKTFTVTQNGANGSVSTFITELLKEDASWHLSFDVKQSDVFNPDMGYSPDDSLTAFAIDFRCKVEMTLTLKDGTVAKVEWYGDPDHDPASWVMNIGFTYNSALTQNYAEIKEGMPLEEQYEAMSAMPTDRTLFYAAGGSEFLIVSEFELRQQPEAIRKYEIKAETVYCNHDFATLTYGRSKDVPWDNSTFYGCTGDKDGGPTRLGSTDSPLEDCANKDAWNGESFCEVLANINCLQVGEQMRIWERDKTTDLGCSTENYKHYTECSGHDLYLVAYWDGEQIQYPPQDLDGAVYTAKSTFDDIEYDGEWAGGATTFAVNTDCSHPSTCTYHPCTNEGKHSEHTCNSYYSHERCDGDHKSHSSGSATLGETKVAPCVISPVKIIGYEVIPHYTEEAVDCSCSGSNNCPNPANHLHTIDYVTLRAVKCKGAEDVTYSKAGYIGYETALSGDEYEDDAHNFNKSVTEETYSAEGIHGAAEQHCACCCGELHKPCNPHTQTYSESWTTKLMNFPYMAIKECQIWRLEDNKMELNEELNYNDDVIIGTDVGSSYGNRDYGTVYLYRGVTTSSTQQGESGRLVYSFHPGAGLAGGGGDTLDIYKFMCMNYSESVNLTGSGPLVGAQGNRAFEKIESKDRDKEYPGRYSKDEDNELSVSDKWFTSTICEVKHTRDGDANLHSSFKETCPAFAENHGVVYYKYLQYLNPALSEEVPEGDVLGEPFAKGDAYGRTDGGRASVTVVSDFLVLAGHDEALQMPYYHEYTVYFTKKDPDTFNTLDLRKWIEVSNSDGKQEGYDKEYFLSTYEAFGFGRKAPPGTGLEYQGTTVTYTIGSGDSTSIPYGDDNIEGYVTCIRKNNDKATWVPSDSKSVTTDFKEYVLLPKYYSDLVTFGPELTEEVVGTDIASKVTATDKFALINDFWFFNSTSNGDSANNDGNRDCGYDAVGMTTDGVVTAGYNGSEGTKFYKKGAITKYSAKASGSMVYNNRTTTRAGYGLGFLFSNYMKAGGVFDKAGIYNLRSTTDGKGDLNGYWISGKSAIDVDRDAVNKTYTYDDTKSKCFYRYLSELTVSDDAIVIPVHGAETISWTGNKQGFETYAYINDVVAYDPIGIDASVYCPDDQFFDQRTDESKATQLNTDEVMNLESSGVFTFSLKRNIQEGYLNNRGYSSNSSVSSVIENDNLYTGEYFTNEAPATDPENTGLLMDTTEYCRSKRIVADNYIIVDTNGDGNFSDEVIQQPGVPFTVAKYKFLEDGTKVSLDTYAFYIPSMAHETRKMTVKFIAETINDPSSEIYNTANHNRYEYTGELDRHHEAVDEVTITVVGRIGNLTMVDSGDFRYATFFKCVSGIAGDWLVPNVVQGIVPNKQNSVVIDSVDIYQNPAGSAETHYNTYGSQAHKYAVDVDAIIDNSMEEHWVSASRPNYFSFPLMPEYNNIVAFRTAPPRVGYTAYLDVETIGEYYTGDSYVTVEYSYYGMPAEGDELEPLDVFMWHNDEYELINDFYNTRRDELYSYPIFMNWADSKVRRMYTEEEARRTAEVNANWKDSGYFNMENKEYIDLSSISEIGPNGFSTYQGDCETIYLGYDSRTFIGNYIYKDAIDGFGDNDNTDVAESIDKWMFYRDSQKWYFSNELPSSAVFVLAGRQPTEENIKEVEDNYEYVIVVGRIIAHGPTWDLQHDGQPSWDKLREDFPDIPDDPVYPPPDPDDPLDPDEPDDPDTPDDPDNPDDPDDPDDPPDDPPPPTVIMIIPPDKSSRDDLDTSGTH